LFEILIGGCLRAVYVLPLLLGFAVVARHGRYLPLWLPQVGTLAAYTAYVLAERCQWRTGFSVVGAVTVVVVGAMVLHRLLFARFVERRQPYPSLIRSIAIIVIVQAFLGLLTGGYALSYLRMTSTWQIFVGPPVNDTLRVPDLIALAIALVAPAVLRPLIERTRFGLSYRAVASSRSLAHEYGLPVVIVDRGVLFLGSVLSAVGGIVYGLHYGLSPDMLTAPTLDVVAVVVAVGSERLWSACLLLIGVGVLQSFCQASAAISSFEYAVSYVVLAFGLAMHHLFLPSWRAATWRFGVRGRAAGSTV